MKLAKGDLAGFIFIAILIALALTTGDACDPLYEHCPGE